MLRTAIFFPCFNEEKTIDKVIKDFKKAIPEAAFFLIDNASTDSSVAIAKANSINVLTEKKLGKGHVVRKAFAEIDADIYVMVDGDDTYAADDVIKLINLVKNEDVDMAIGTRLQNFQKENKAALHSFGNKFFVFLVNFIFHSKIEDIFSGYRAISKKFVKNAPLLSSGFEIESEMTIQALERDYVIKEIPVQYQSRPAGSFSKLKTFSDGWKILLTIFSIFRDYRPMAFFSIIAFCFFLLGLFFGFVVIIDYLQKGIVTRVPYAILTTLLIIMGCLSFIGGFIVSAINRRYQELEEIIKKKNN